MKFKHVDRKKAISKYWNRFNRRSERAIRQYESYRKPLGFILPEHVLRLRKLHSAKH